MLRLFRWLGFRDKALDQLGALLLMYPRGRQFTADFAGLRQAMRAHFEAGISPAGSAVQIAAAIAGDLVRQLAPKQRAEVRERLQAFEPGTLEALAQRQIAGMEARPADSAVFAAQLAGVALFLARRMTEEATLHRSEYEYLLAEIEAASGPRDIDEAAPPLGEAEPFRLKAR